MAGPTVLTGEQLRARVGEEVFASAWIEVTQAMIDTFADATGDHQWIHVDPERARQSPFGTTIAHGFLTLSLLSRMFGESLEVGGTRMGVNYGCNRLRFTAPVRSGSRIRGRFLLREVTDIDGGLQFTWEVTVEAEGATKPCLVAEWLTRRYL